MMAETWNTGQYKLVEIVDPECACPKCGEDVMDLLAWIDSDMVRCASCGAEYDPAVQARWYEA